MKSEGFENTFNAALFCISSLLNVEELQCGSFYDSISGHTDLSPSHNLLDLLRKRNEFIQNRLTGWKLLVELLLIDRDSDHKYYSIAWSCIMKLLERYGLFYFLFHVERCKANIVIFQGYC